MSQHTSCPVNQQGAQVRVASLADPVQTHLAARASLFWCEANPGGKFSPRPERLRFSHRGDRRRRRQ
jgi:hypothetical protein